MRQLLLRTALLLLTAAATLAAASANKLYIKSFSIAPGESKVVEVYMVNDTPVRAVEMLVVLPAGLTLSPEQTVLTGRQNGHTLSARLTSKGYRVLAFSTNNTPFRGNDGPLMELTVTADSGFDRSGTIEMSEIIMESESGAPLVEMGRCTCDALWAPAAATPAGGKPDINP
ncbi:MAG: hypothetical protein IJT30_10235 [Muribaculaceae bacterium]|nr:hypothetical protein [Muribaculaceae bacterium]